MTILPHIVTKSIPIKFLGCSLLLPAFCVYPTIATGQSLVLEEVIVTARKRAESLQTAPVAVSAMGQDALRELGVRNLKDLNQIVPNVEVQDSNGSSGIANVYIRGVGQRNSGANIDSGVGVYIDGVYLGRPDGALLDLNDAAQVQVLRGPQGTLFGKNTTGGAMVFTTNRPTDVLEGNLAVRLGNYDRQDISGALNIPLTESLLTRLSVNSVSRDGYVENILDGKDYASEDRISAIWQLRWLPSEDVTVDLNANYASTDQLGKPLKCEVAPDSIGWQSSLLNGAAVVPATGRTLEEFCSDSEALRGTDKAISNVAATYESDNAGLSLTAQWDLNDQISLKSITAWRNTEAGDDIDLDFTEIPFLSRQYSGDNGQSFRETDQYSQEFEISGSAFDDQMQYVGGLFWFNEETSNDRAVNYLGPFDPAVAGLFNLNPVSSLVGAENQAWAVFSQIEWSFSEQLLGTVGIRYTDEKREYSNQLLEVDTETLGLNGGVLAGVGGGLYVVDRSVFEYSPDFQYLPPAPENLRSGEVNNTDVTPMASVQYILAETDWMSQGMIYLAYAEGFLSGGLSEGPSPDLEEFEPEEVTSWELGIKLDLFDRRFRVNAALFQSDYDNRQLTTLVINPQTSLLAPSTINAEKSSIRGLEIETIWLATDNLTLQLNATFNDADIDTFTDVQIGLADASAPPADNCTRADLVVDLVDACVIDRSDESLPRLPEQSFFASIEYYVDTQFGDFTPRLQASLKKDVDYCISHDGCLSGQWAEDEQFELSGRVGWISEDRRWVGAVYGNNLTDEAYVTGASEFTEAFGIGGVGYAIPRTYGVELQYNF